MKRILIVAGIVVAATILSQTVFRDDQPELVVESDDLEQHPAEHSNPTESSDNSIPIYLVGAVKHPGIYRVEPGCYLYELIEQAGGLEDTAAADQINLAMRLEQNGLIRIPTIEEAKQNPDSTDLSGNGGENGLTDLNRADQAELEQLPGIGPVTAKAILDYRNENGPFQCIEDLMKVPGIKESRFNAIRDLIRVTG